MSQEDLELRKAFFVESVEILEKLQNDVSAMEADPKNVETINAVFRGLHTIKGNSSFLSLDGITKLGHAAETLLDKARKKELPVTPAMLVIIRRVLAELGTMIGEQDVGRDVLPLANAILQFVAGDFSATEKIAQVAPSKSGSIQKLATGTFVRVDENKINKIVGLVSELELARYALEKIPEKIEAMGPAAEELRFEVDLQISKLARLSKSLSGIVFGVRLVPVNTIFQRFSHVVNDLAKKLGKEIQLRILNGDAELDKNIVEAIADPMTHLIRNSADHGIESKEERLTAGKKIQGTITLNSFVQGNFVYIEICDDGRGIDGDKILKKAVEKGIVPKEKAALFNPAQKRALIFAPGFSTAEAVTDISGRGVGMDVVKSNINKLRGTVILDSIVGRGTVIQLRFPMSLAVLFSLFVRIDALECAFPMDQVDESYDYRRGDFLSAIPEGENREEYLALYSLRSLIWGHEEELDREKFHVLRFRGKFGKNMGFFVDEFSSIEEAIVQAVDSYVAALPGIQGASVRKDGSVALVLNPVNILELTANAKPFAYAKIKPKTAEVEESLADFLLNSGSEQAA